MNLNDRITRLEAMFRPTVSLPVELEECELFADRPGARTILRSRDGAKWDQAPGEELDAFKARVKAEAVRGFRADAGDTAIRLVVLRPRMSRDAWTAEYNPEAASA